MITSVSTFPFYQKNSKKFSRQKSHLHMERIFGLWAVQNYPHPNFFFFKISLVFRVNTIMVWKLLIGESRSKACPHCLTLVRGFSLTFNFVSNTSCLILHAYTSYGTWRLLKRAQGQNNFKFFQAPVGLPLGQKWIDCWHGGSVLEAHINGSDQLSKASKITQLFC